MITRLVIAFLALVGAATCLLAASCLACEVIRR